MHKKLTLHQELYSLVVKHGLHEVTDRLQLIVSEQLDIQADDGLHQCLIQLELLTRNACELEIEFK